MFQTMFEFFVWKPDMQYASAWLTLTGWCVPAAGNVSSNNLNDESFDSTDQGRLKYIEIYFSCEGR